MVLLQLRVVERMEPRGVVCEFLKKQTKKSLKVAHNQWDALLVNLLENSESSMN